jgi:hypothetical protein
LSEYEFGEREALALYEANVVGSRKTGGKMTVLVRLVVKVRLFEFRGMMLEGKKGEVVVLDADIVQNERIKQNFLRQLWTLCAKTLRGTRGTSFPLLTAVRIRMKAVVTSLRWKAVIDTGQRRVGRLEKL